MHVMTAISKERDIDALIEDFQNQFGAFKPSLLLVFASSSYNSASLAEALDQGFPAALSLGCSTAGELAGGWMEKGSVVAMGLSGGIISGAKAVVLKNINKINTEELKPAFELFSSHFQEDYQQMTMDRYLGLVLVDGLSQSEEKLMDCLGNISNLMFVGGSAGDDLAFQKTHVFVHGKTYSNAAVLLLVKPAKGFDLLKTQSFTSSEKCLVATKVDEGSREVKEFNNQPASQAYAQALGIPESEAADHFMDHPVGLIIEDEPYVRSPQQIKDQKMVFYCQVKEGMELHILDGGDIVSDTQKALEEKIAERGEKPKAIINFNCILRTLELEKNGQTQAYADLFKEIPTVGFSTYGEQYIGHINQTATMVLLY